MHLPPEAIYLIVKIEIIKMKKPSYIYIMTNYDETTLYTGVTSDLVKRVYEHKNKLREGFTNKYNVNKLVYYEVFDGIESAIEREKQIKGGSRAKKIKLINQLNPDWIDLYDTIIGQIASSIIS